MNTTVRYYRTQTRMAIIKILPITNAVESVEKREASDTVGGNIHWYSHCGKQYGASPEN